MESEEDSNDYSLSQPNNNHFKIDIKNPMITKFSLLAILYKIVLNIKDIFKK